MLIPYAVNHASGRWPWPVAGQQSATGAGARICGVARSISHLRVAGPRVYFVGWQAP
ncbi:MAG: hypothetical protein ACPL8I_06675 [Chloroflexaceae bacterium]